jgi:thiamine pyrophosphate-dependent acetolactate synthase large subunit-like protein
MNDTTSTIVHDSPVPAQPSDVVFGSDAIAAVLRALDLPYIALNPGASYRGLHDSLVNYLGNRNPQMILCLHDENAVSIAQGYYKASDRMMAAALHSNVGLMHATMPIFDAWCDRVPIMVIGATGEWDAAKRRPWIEWIHTCSDQGQLVRNFTKWDNQARARQRDRPKRCCAPRRSRRPRRAGPGLRQLDVGIQEQRLETLPPLPDVGRYAPPEAAAPSRADG